MTEDVEVGVAGSLTMIVLFSSIALLMRSFYKRYQRMNKDVSERENEGDN
jgi:hypothetical protein